MEDRREEEIAVSSLPQENDDPPETSSLCDQATCHDPGENNTQSILPSNPAPVNHCGVAVGMTSSALSTVESALVYARMGFPVLPLAGKVPVLKGGYKAATTDEATIRGWWAKWPDANIGIATGARSKLLVVDVDPRNGGFVSLARLRPLLEGDSGEIIAFL